MPDQNLLNIFTGLVGAAGGWWMKIMWESLRELRVADEALSAKVAAIDVLVAGSYVKRDEFERLSEAIFAKLDRIEDKLDRKADKP